MCDAGGHGAGLTNMLFAPQNASVIEFGLNPHIDRCFGYMAMALGLDYWVLPQISTHLYLRYTMDEGKAEAAVRLVRHLERKGLIDHSNDENHDENHDEL